MIRMMALAFAMGGVQYAEPKHDPFNQGHWYDWHCCELDHCHPAREGEVEQEGLGYRVHGEWLSFNDVRILQSQDFRVHVCILNDAVRCLYLPGVKS